MSTYSQSDDRADGMMVDDAGDLMKALLLAALVLLPACSGGGDGGGGAAAGGGTPGGGGGGTVTLADTLLFYNSLTPVPSGTTPIPTDGTLHALDPANPTNPITVDTGLSSVVYVGLLAGTYTGSTKTLSNLHPHRVIYPKDGKLYQVSAFKNDSRAPVQISSETRAWTFGANCPFSDLIQIYADWANPSQSYVQYTDVGQDGVCDTGDEVSSKLVRLDMSSSTPPIISPVSIIGPLRSPATGAIIGWLGWNGTTLQRLDANLQNPVTVLSNVTDVTPIIVGDFTGLQYVAPTHLFLAISKKVRAYDVQNGNLSGELCTFLDTTGIANFFPDENFLYIAEGGLVSRERLWRVPKDGSEACTLLADLRTSSARFNAQLHVTDTRVLLSGLGSISSIPKAGGTMTTLVDPIGSIGQVNVSGRNVFYGSQVIDPFTGAVSPSAGSLREDGTEPINYPNTQLTTMALPTGTFRSNLTEGRPQDLVRKLVLVDRTIPSTPTLKAIDGTTRDLVTLGTLSSGLEGFFVFGLEDTVLGSFGVPSSPSDTDVYFMDADRPNSLLQVTNTPGRAESVVPFYGF